LFEKQGFLEEKQTGDNASASFQRAEPGHLVHSVNPHAEKDERRQRDQCMDRLNADRDTAICGSFV